MIRLHYKLYRCAAVALLGACGSSAAISPDHGSGAPSEDAGGDATAAAQSSDDGGSRSESPDAMPVGSHGNDSGSPMQSPGASDGGVEAAAGPRPSPGCGDGGGAVSATVNLTYDGLARTYDLHVPASGGAGPWPLVLNLHGYTMSSGQQASLTNMNALSDTEGFLVAYPQGVGSPTDWNAGSCCSAASEGDRDDVGFLGAVIDDIAAKSCVDLARVYSIGFSNGGMMTYRLACEDAQRFAAAASVSGSAAIPLNTCAPAHPMPLMHIHGNADPLVPYDGGPGGLPLAGRPTPVFPAAADEVATFRTNDGCPSTSSVYFDAGNAECDHWGPCAGGSEVVFCTIDQGGHAWPGGDGLFSESSPLDATSQIWTFLKRHTLP